LSALKATRGPASIKPGDGVAPPVRLQTFWFLLIKGKTSLGTINACRFAAGMLRAKAKARAKI
jgi:hypothetical protein